MAYLVLSKYYFESINPERSDAIKVRLESELLYQTAYKEFADQNIPLIFHGVQTEDFAFSLVDNVKTKEGLRTSRPTRYSNCVYPQTMDNIHFYVPSKEIHLVVVTC